MSPSEYFNELLIWALLAPSIIAILVVVSFSKPQEESKETPQNDEPVNHFGGHQYWI